MRLFAAFPLPAEIVSGILHALEPVRAQAPRAKWVDGAGLHVTVHFFGECSDEDLRNLKRVFDDPGLRVPPIPARLGQVGQFPEHGSPRVLWVGFHRGEEGMHAFWDLFESRISGQGWEREARGFSPHVTLARAGSFSFPAGWPPAIRMPAVDFSLEECVLFQSVLGPAGATYHAQGRIPLGRGSP